MKHYIGINAFLTLLLLCAGSLEAQSLKERLLGWLPSDPRTSLNPVESNTPSIRSPLFSFPQFKTPQAVSNAIQRLVQAFNFLSPRTLTNIIKNQKEKFENNSLAFAENPTWANRGALVGNLLAIAAATLVLAGETAVVGYGLKTAVESGKQYQQKTK